MAKKALAVNEDLEQLLGDLARRENVGKDEVLLRSVALLKFLKDNDVVMVKGIKADSSEVEVKL